MAASELPRQLPADRPLGAYSLLIGSALLFVALTAVMYATRNLNWGGGDGGEIPEEPAAAEA
jgi:inner membrane protein